MGPRRGPPIKTCLPPPEPTSSKGKSTAAFAWMQRRRQSQPRLARLLWHQSSSRYSPLQRVPEMAPAPQPERNKTIAPSQWQTACFRAKNTLIPSCSKAKMIKTGTGAQKALSVQRCWLETLSCLRSFSRGSFVLQTRRWSPRRLDLLHRIS